MKKALTIAVSTRDVRKSVRSLRAQGSVPGILYGGKVKSTPVACNAKELNATFLAAGENTLVDVTLDGKVIPCLIHAVSFHPVSGAYEHVDLLAVDMTKKVTTHIPIILTGESAAVKTLGGVLVTVHSQLEVTCLPQDLPEHFTVDIAVLENFRDAITVSQLTVPSGVTVKAAPETVIVTVQEPRKEEEVLPVAAAMPTEGAVAEGAAAPAEGAAPATAGAPAAAKPAEKAAAGGKEKK